MSDGLGMFSGWRIIDGLSKHCIGHRQRRGKEKTWDHMEEHGLSHKFARGTKQGVWVTEAPSKVQGQSPGGGLGEAPEAGDIW